MNYDFDVEAMEMLENSFRVYTDGLLMHVMDEPGFEDFQTASGELFCGCEVCDVREVFAFLVPRILDLYRQELIWKVVDGDVPALQEG